MFLFVYGTLKRGQVNHHLLNGDFVSKAKIFGFDLYDIGSFPGIYPGSEEVEGEIYRVNKKTIQFLDWFEIGYKREKIVIDDKDVFVYVLLKPRGLKCKQWPK